VVPGQGRHSLNLRYVVFARFWRGAGGSGCPEKLGKSIRRDDVPWAATRCEIRRFQQTNYVFAEKHDVEGDNSGTLDLSLYLTPAEIAATTELVFSVMAANQFAVYAFQGLDLDPDFAVIHYSTAALDVPSDEDPELSHSVVFTANGKGTSVVVPEPSFVVGLLSMGCTAAVITSLRRRKAFQTQQ